MNKLTFGLGPEQEPHIITMGVPEELAETVSGPVDGFMHQLREAQSLKVAEVVLDYASALEMNNTKVAFNLKKVGAKRIPHGKRDSLAAITKCIESVSAWSHDYSDPRLHVELYSAPVPGDGRLGMMADIQWPEASDDDLTELATQTMRQAAFALRHDADMEEYQGKKIRRSRWIKHIESMVYAQVSRDRGVTLETNPMGSCSLGTDGSWYQPTDETFEIQAHNIYSHEQQLICLTGCIAIAHADELLATGEPIC